MTVQELIDALQAVKDKTLIVTLNISGVYNSGHDDALGVLRAIDIEEWTETQNYSAKTPVVALSLFANNEIEEKEIVRMRNKNLAPFAHMWETDGVACVLDKNDQVIKRYYYKDNRDYTDLAEYECDRLNEEWRKEHAND